MFAKAHEYNCGHMDINGVKCNGKPKLGEIVQVCVIYTICKKIGIIHNLLNLIFIGTWYSNIKEKIYRLYQLET